MNLTFGKKLKKLRQNHELRQSDLANILQTTQSSIGRYERDEGVPDLDTLRILANYFDISLDSLIDREPKSDNRDKANELRETIEESIKELEDEETLLFMKNGEIDEETTRLLKVAIKNGVKVVNELKKKD
ncbi:helix-turn-helix domain-containing protein [Brochothrix thermosphacta]|uniref:helix-turn-helix domain-containing protein n=1 Tax=Brochothrix thermosphacta TaxID=2756 RepID=UPI00083FB9A0|nr:helix-turn-helix transcriptional regulator [Brochothrix thermosphacta]ODJ63024.1 transcriptional regulator [Brochothrix thermosphacta]